MGGLHVKIAIKKFTMGGKQIQRTNIEWCRNPDGTPGFTWNPIVGCSHGCSYCWARKQAKRFKNRCDECYQFVPHLHWERLEEPLKRKKPSTIAVSLMGDLFCDDVSDYGVERVLNIIDKASQHNFLLLTKAARRAHRWIFSNNTWLGISCDGLDPEEDEMSTYWLLKSKTVRYKYISFEPLLRSLHIGLKGIDWIIIGGQTRPDFHPPIKWVMPIVEQAKKLNIPVFMKDNLGPEYEGQLMQEFPEDLVNAPTT